ncbi:MAG: phosphoserine phosphatase SerB [Gammaproteobacteria bacterium]|nr:MAG: phosphoserine phosphatase SerB [Gammaproteobacteria bacterium]
MNKVLTLVAQQSTDASTLQDTFGNQLVIYEIKQRRERVFDLVCAPDSALSPSLRETLYGLRCDFALQDAQRRPKKVFISDMDATMVVGETIDEMAEILGLGEAISAITARAMRGELDFEAALAERLGLMKGLPQDRIVEMADHVEISPDADKLLAEINQRGIDSFLVSGGFTEFTQQVSRKLGFNSHKANRLGYDENGRLNGTWVGELVDGDVKLATLQHLAEKNRVSLEETIAIGDGANDRLMVEAAGLGVAYYGKPALRQVANAEIHCGTLASLIAFLD